MIGGLQQFLNMGGGQSAQGGPRTLGAMPNPAQEQPQGGILNFEALQSPGMLGLLNAGTSMLGAARRPGGLGEALLAGAQGGLGGVMAARQAQKEDERNKVMEGLMKAQAGVLRGGMAQGPRMGALAPMQPTGIYGAY